MNIHIHIHEYHDVNNSTSWSTWSCSRCSRRWSCIIRRTGCFHVSHVTRRPSHVTIIGCVVVLCVYLLVYTCANAMY